MYNCIICDKDINYMTFEGIESPKRPGLMPVKDGIVCDSIGNYWSSIGVKRVRFAICDGCIVLKADKIYDMDDKICLKKY